MTQRKPQYGLLAALPDRMGLMPARSLAQTDERGESLDSYEDRISIFFSSPGRSDTYKCKPATATYKRSKRK